MATFERVLSWIPKMDMALDNIRLGDNVVWQVTDLDEFQLFTEPYVRQSTSFVPYSNSKMTKIP